MLLLCNKEIAIVATIGASSIYMIRGKSFFLVTKDHPRGPICPYGDHFLTMVPPYCHILYTIPFTIKCTEYLAMHA